MLCSHYAQIATRTSSPLVYVPPQVWEQYPQRVTAIEPSDAMIKLAADLQHAQRAQQPSNSNTYTIQWHRQLHPSMLPTKKFKAQQIGRQTYDLVVASYVLTEMQSDAARQQAVDMLWRQTKDVLVLIEPGTPSGSAHVRHARTQVLNLIVACHLLTCLISHIPYTVLFAYVVDAGMSKKVVGDSNFCVWPLCRMLHPVCTLFVIAASSTLITEIHTTAEHLSAAVYWCYILTSGFLRTIYSTAYASDFEPAFFGKRTGQLVSS